MGKRRAVNVSVPSGMGRVGLWYRMVQGNRGRYRAMSTAVLHTGREQIVTSRFPGHHVSLSGFKCWVPHPKGHGMLVCPLFCTVGVSPSSCMVVAPASCPKSSCLLILPRNLAPQPQNYSPVSSSPAIVLLPFPSPRAVLSPRAGPFWGRVAARLQS